jgi:hypothetical protein
MTLTRPEKIVCSIVGVVLVLLFGAALSGYGLGVLLLGSLGGLVVFPVIVLLAVASRRGEDTPPPP